MQPRLLLTYHMPDATYHIVALLLTAAMGLSAGCKLEYREVPGSSTWDKFPQDEKLVTDDGKGAEPSYGYTIEMTRFTGPDRHIDALNQVQQLQREANLTELWTQDDGKTATVNYGRFKNRDQLEAKTALGLVRNIQLDQETPFKGVSLVAIARGERVALNPLDLRQYSQSEDYYTLEVAIFTPETPKYRAAAESYAAELRNKGEEAYFYHGPNTSSVTIGAMPQEIAFEWVNGREQYSQLTREIQQRFPSILVNNQTPEADPDHPELGKEQTKLVRIPSF